MKRKTATPYGVEFCKTNPGRINSGIIRCNASTILLASATILMGKLSRFAEAVFELVPIVFDPDSQLLLQCEIRLLATEF